MCIRKLVHLITVRLCSTTLANRFPSGYLNALWNEMPGVHLRFLLELITPHFMKEFFVCQRYPKITWKEKGILLAYNRAWLCEEREFRCRCIYHETDAVLCIFGLSPECKGTLKWTLNIMEWFGWSLVPLCEVLNSSLYNREIGTHLLIG